MRSSDWSSEVCSADLAAPAEPTAEEKLAETRASAEKTAAAMGEGVSFKEVEALPAQNGRQGVRIVYAFTDINKVTLAVMPAVDLGGGLKIGSQGGQETGIAACRGSACREVYNY